VGSRRGPGFAMPDVSSIPPKIPYGGFSLSTAPTLAYQMGLP
jgi:hypothetical protein